MSLNSDMKCIVKEKAGPGNIVLTRRPIPQIGDNDILVKVLAASICGTDIHIDEWNEFIEKRLVPPIIIGHEFAGEVVDVGKNVNNVKIGDIVSSETHTVCHTCDLCRNGFEHVCYNTRSIGLHKDGCFAEYISVPAENAFVCSKDMPIEIASIMEPFGVAVHGAMEFPIASKTVAVTGCGPIGVMAVAVAKKIGASKIIAVEINEKRSQFALDMGADYIVNPAKENCVEKVKSLTGGKGVDVVLEFSGNPTAIKNAIEFMKPEAKMAAVGLPNGSVDFNFSEFVYRGLTLKGIAGRKMYKTWEQMRGLLEGGLDLSKIVTHVLPLEQYQEGFRLMRDLECCKAVLKL